MPIRNAGPKIIKDQNDINHWWGDVLNMLMSTSVRYSIPASENAIAPTISYFQDMNKIINKINDGMLCSKSMINASPKLDAESKTSKENKDKNSINTMARIRGVQ